MNTADVDTSDSTSAPVSPVLNATDSTNQSGISSEYPAGSASDTPGSTGNQEECSAVTVAAVDTSGSTYGTDYSKSVNRVLQTLTPPLSVIQWNSTANLTHYKTILPKCFMFPSTSYTYPKTFMKLLKNFDKPINLYIFTDGKIYPNDVKKCREILKNSKNLVINKVNLYYFGEKNAMNLKFINVFEGLPTTIYINSQDQVGSINPDFNFDQVDYDYIMKDDSFKATILLMLSSSGIDKGRLKKLVSEKSASILKSYFKRNISIGNFYESKDVEGCIKYVKDHSFYNAKCDFQRKISDILKMFDPKVDSYEVTSFCTIPEATELTYEEPELECEYLKCDVLYENCKTGCIPIKKCMDIFWFDKKVLQNPFSILESEPLMKRVVDLAEPYIMDYDNVYKRIEDCKKDTVSPFSRDVLKGAYVLNNGKINPKDLIRHNNYVLSTLFQNTLPGKDVLWHMIFLYILAQKRFPELKERLYEEIRFLGKQREYFLPLNPFLNPPIVEKLEICFWYIAHVCHRAFPNSKKNLLRFFPFNPQLFLQFYKDVYEPDYQAPENLPLWRLWKTLIVDRSFIFPILSHYFESEKLSDDSEDPFEYVLYNKLKSPDKRSFSAAYGYLSELDLETVLKVYCNVLKTNQIMVYDEIQLKEETIEFRMERTKAEDKLDHVKIHLRTCHPLVTCPETGRHWKKCIGQYDILRESNLRLFRKYCMKYDQYPSGWKDLLVFQNMRLYKRQDEIPELFDYSIRKVLQTVMAIFQDVMSTYPCELYLECADKHIGDELRMKAEKMFAYDDPPEDLTKFKESLAKKKNKKKAIITYKLVQQESSGI